MSAFFLHLCGIIISTLAILNRSILFGDLFLNFNETLNQAYTEFIWWSSDKRSNNEIVNVSIVAFYGISQIIVFLRDMYQEIFFIVGLVPLWLISVDFKRTIDSVISATVNSGRLPATVQDTVIKQYRKICKLIWQFNKSHGYPLLGYFLVSTFHYSLRFDNFFLKEHGIGAKFFRLEYMCTLVSIIGLGAMISHNVRFKKDIKCLIVPRFYNCHGAY